MKTKLRRSAVKLPQLVKVAFLMQSEMSFPSYYLCIYHRQTEGMNIDCGCNNNSLRSTKSGLFKCISLAVADS